MRNKFFYRVYRLRRTVFLGGLLPMIPLAICSFLPFFEGVLDLNLMLKIWAANTGFVAILAMFFPSAIAEVFLLVCAYALAIFAVIAMAVLMQAEGRAPSQKILIGFGVGWGLVSFVLFFVLAGNAGRHETRRLKKPHVMRNSIWINASPSQVYEALRAKETSNSWHSQCVRVEKVNDEPLTFRSDMRRLNFDEKTLKTFEDTFPVFSTLAETRVNEGETIVCQDDEGTLAETHSFVVKAENEGTRLTTESVTQGLPVANAILFWLSDYIVDFDYHKKEAIEGLPPIAISSIGHQKFLPIWILEFLGKITPKDDPPF